MVQVSMSMAVPNFLFFAVFCVVNVYLPVFFRNMGFSSTLIGILLGIFEVSGIVFTFFLCKFPEKSGKFGLWLIILGLVSAVLSFPLLLGNIYIVIIALIFFAVPNKAIIPISDSFIHLRLGGNSEGYGKIRTFGSIGFVVMSLIMQRYVDTDSITQLNSAIWLATPAVLMCISIFLIPKLLIPLTQTEVKSVKSDESTGTPMAKKGFFNQFSRDYWMIILLLVFGYFALFGPSKFFSLYVKEYLHSDSFSLLWSISVAAEVPAMFFSYKFIKRFGSKKLILFCVATIAVRNFTYVLFPTVAGAAFAQLFHCFTFGLLHPATVVFIANEVKSAKNGVTAQAISSVGASGLATVAGSFLGGIIIDRFGYAQMYTLYGFVPLIGLVIYFILRKKV